jgi:hypothetical protein
MKDKPEGTSKLAPFISHHGLKTTSADHKSLFAKKAIELFGGLGSPIKKLKMHWSTLRLATPFFFIFLSACGAPAPPELRTARCYARFDAGTGEQTAEFTLFKNARDTSEQAVEMPGGIFYQGVSMLLRKIPAPAYRRSYKTAFSPEQRFSWKDVSGKNTDFDLAMTKIDSFWFDKTVLSKNAPATLYWSGGGLEKGETLVLFWENAVSGQNTPIELYADGAPSSILLPAAKIKELAPGDWSLYLVRKKLTRGAAGGMPITGVTEYYTRAKNVRIQ